MNVKTSFCFKRFALFLLTATLLCACAKEKTNDAQQNRLYFGSELDVPISGAALHVIGKDLNYYDPYFEGIRYKLILYTDGLSLTFNDFGKVVKYTGEGYFLELTFNSETAPEPETRNYYANMPYVDGYQIGSTWSFSLQYYHPTNGFYEGSFRHGSVSLRKNGGNWIIEGRDLVTYHNGKGASFYYEGIMEIYDQRKS